MPHADAPFVDFKTTHCISHCACSIQRARGRRASYLFYCMGAYLTYKIIKFTSGTRIMGNRQTYYVVRSIVLLWACCTIWYSIWNLCMAPFVSPVEVIHQLHTICLVWKVGTFFKFISHISHCFTFVQVRMPVAHGIQSRTSMRRMRTVPVAFD